MAVFVGINASDAAESWDAMRRWGHVPASDVWDGEWWGLVTSAFVHVEIWHVAFNVYWLWILGRVLEQAVGPVRWLLLCLSAAFVSSAAQLAWSDDTGIGFSGVVYAFFAFMWAARRRWPVFAEVVSRDTVSLFLVWLVLCVGLSATGVWNVGNAAHVAGLAYGASLGAAVAIQRRRVAAVAGAGALLVASIGVLFYAPWSQAWTCVQAYRLHADGDYDAAERHYLRARDLGAEPGWVLENLARLYAANGDRKKYDDALGRLREIDPAAARRVEGGE